jgi:prepilin-type processing-associated H-X9-DG protein
MISLGSGSLLLAGKAPVEDVGRRLYVEALVGAWRSPEIVTSSRANISFLDGRDLRGRVDSGRGASEVFAGIP